MPSNVIRRFWYDPAQRQLNLLFVSGRRYRYHDVPEETYRSMTRAFSKGEFFNANIRDRYRHSQHFQDPPEPSPMPSPAIVPRQSSLFEAMPPGLEVRDEFITPPEEAALMDRFSSLPFQPFAFQGWFGKRETVSFGWRYDFNDARLHVAPPLPEFLLPLRERAAAFAEVAPEALEQALVIRYDVGAGIGWHRDRPAFDRVVGISLAAPCVLRFRRRRGAKFQRYSVDARPRSAYLLTGEIRHEWEHSIAPLEQLRYSLTFRSRSGS
jgi:DNA oxidative demethylase